MRRAGLIVAVIAAVIGGVLGARAIFPTFLSPGRPPAVALPPAPAPPAVVLPQFSLPVAPELNVAVTAETAAEIAAEMARRAGAQIDADVGISGLGVEAAARLKAAIQEQSAIYLSGSFDKYQEWVRRSGGRREFIDKAGDDPAARKKAVDTVREVWNAMASTIALKPVSVEHVKVRLRWVRGAEVRTPDDTFFQAIVTMPDRWPRLAGEPKANGYTIVEYLFPVFYFRESEGTVVSGTVYFAVWFVWDSEARDWRIHQTRLYNPLRLPYNFTCPQF